MADCGRNCGKCPARRRGRKADAAPRPPAAVWVALVGHLTPGGGEGPTQVVGVRWSRASAEKLALGSRGLVEVELKNESPRHKAWANDFEYMRIERHVAKK